MDQYQAGGRAPNPLFPVMEMPPVTWSYSALEAYELCPHNYHQVRVLKAYKEPPSKALDDGNRVHDAIDRHIRLGDPLPLGLKKAGQVVERLARGARGVKSEHQVNVDRWWHPTGVFAKDIWLRCKIDVAVKRPNALAVVDWKTGKQKPNNDQAQINALSVLATVVDVLVVTTLFYYTETDKIDRHDFTMHDAPRLLGALKPRLERLHGSVTAQHFAKKPGWKCRFCPVTTCEHNQSGQQRGQITINNS